VKYLTYAYVNANAKPNAMANANSFKQRYHEILNKYGKSKRPSRRLI
jgi:hypothetical protein